MADQQISVTGPEHITVRSILYASVAGTAIGVPLLGMMGSIFVASITLLLISSPLLIIFSPLLIVAALFLVASTASLAVAIAMGLAGILILRRVFRSFQERSSVGFERGGIIEKPRESGQTVKDRAAGYLETEQMNEAEVRVIEVE